MYSQEGNVAGMEEGEEMLVEDEVREVGTGVEGADRVDLWLWLLLSQVIKLLSREVTRSDMFWKDHSGYCVEEILQGGKAQSGETS